MKRTTPILMLVLMLLLTAWMMPATAEENPTLLTLYEGPKTMTTSATAKVTANGNDLFVYDVMVNHEHIWNANTQPTTTPMTYFDFEGKVRIEVEMPGLPDKVESAVVIPQSWGITPEVKDGKVSFIITEPGQYTVVFNDNVNKALHIFANPLETDVPDPDDPNVYYIPSGEWVMDAIALEDGQTLYISGGAVLHSIISVNNAKNVRAASSTAATTMRGISPARMRASRLISITQRMSPSTALSSPIPTAGTLILTPPSMWKSTTSRSFPAVKMATASPSSPAPTTP